MMILLRKIKRTQISPGSSLFSNFRSLQDMCYNKIIPILVGYKMVSNSNLNDLLDNNPELKKLLDKYPELKRKFENAYDQYGLISQNNLTFKAQDLTIQFPTKNLVPKPQQGYKPKLGFFAQQNARTLQMTMSYQNEFKQEIIHKLTLNPPKPTVPVPTLPPR